MNNAVTADVFALTMAHPNQKVRIVGVDGGGNLHARLCALGLTPGMTAEVVSAYNGPVILIVLGSRVVIGHGMADKIQVREVF